MLPLVNGNVSEMTLNIDFPAPFPPKMVMKSFMNGQGNIVKNRFFIKAIIHNFRLHFNSTIANGLLNLTLLKNLFLKVGIMRQTAKITALYRRR